MFSRLQVIFLPLSRIGFALEGVVITLEQPHHGVENIEAYQKQLFLLREVNPLMLLNVAVPPSALADEDKRPQSHCIGVLAKREPFGIDDHNLI